MGRVPATGLAKVFEGSPTNTSNYADINSIQGAIKGTLSDPALATKNGNTLRNLARLDMFVPKRTTLPVDTAAFRNFPTVTISPSNFQSSYNSSGDLFVSFRINVNNRVGYAIPFVFSFTVGSSLDAPTNGVGEGTTSHTFMLLAGSTFVTATFDRSGVPNNTNWSIGYTGSSQEPIYDTALFEFSGTASTSSGTLSSRTVYTNNYGSAFCYDPNDPFELQSPSLTHYFSGFTLGSKVWGNASGTNPANNGAYIESNSEFSYEVLDGSISTIVFCQ